MKCRLLWVNREKLQPNWGHIFSVLCGLSYGQGSVCSQTLLMYLTQQRNRAIDSDYPRVTTLAIKMNWCMDRQTSELLGSIWQGLSEALFNYIKTTVHRHDTGRAPDSTARERRNKSSGVQQHTYAQTRTCPETGWQRHKPKNTEASHIHNDRKLRQKISFLQKTQTYHV